MPMHGERATMGKYIFKVNALWYIKDCTNCIVKQCHTETMYILNPKPKKECEN